MGAQEEQVRAGPSHGSQSTLGDVLYKDRTIPQKSETAWVALVRAVAARDAQSLHSLYEQSNRVVYTLALRLTGSPEAAEEVTLQVFYDVWSNAATYHAAGGTVLGWIMNQARSRGLERARKDALATRAGTQNSLPFEERARRLQEALQALTPEEREAIETTYFSEMTHADAARRLKMPAGDFRDWIRSGLMKLRHAIAGKT
jgi:RNA polymerase sigma-70 factor, ECF subfamily